MKSKISTFIMGYMLISNSIANDVYIEQIGSSTDITITQTGLDNIIGAALTPSFFGGDNNIVNITQTGSRNSLNSITNGDSLTLTLEYTGDDNSETINCGTSMSKTCNDNLIQHTVTGDSNTITTSITKGTTTSKMTVSGNSNTITHNSTSEGVVSSDLTLAGNSNNISLTQQGTIDKSITINSTGSNNNLTVVQHNQ